MSLLLGLWLLPEEIRTNCGYWEQLPLRGEGPLLGGSDSTWEGACGFCLVQPPRRPPPHPPSLHQPPRWPPPHLLASPCRPPPLQASPSLLPETQPAWRWRNTALQAPGPRVTEQSVGGGPRPERGGTWPSGSSGLKP